ncbi:MAG: leucyl aminopeptidase [Candidatus Aminicenantes bacterium]|nr:MAG: leucyl aminopeptidase [Candidatus Aminicenantes bacterium]
MKIVREQKLNLKNVEAVVIPVFETRNLTPIVLRYPEAEFFIRRYKFKGKAGKDIVFNSADKKILIVIVGAGHPHRLADTVECSKKVISALKQDKIKKAVVHFLQDLDKLRLGRCFWANFLDYLFTSHYSFDTYKSSEDKIGKIDRIGLYFDAQNPPTLLTNSFIKERETINRCVDRARDLVNETPSKVNPDYMAVEFERAAQEYQLDILIYREKELQDLGLNGILAVGEASPYESALIRLSYIPGVSMKNVALVGKGITFDSGGLNLKPGKGLADMKSDMSGAAAVLGILEAVSTLGLPVMVTAYAPVAENMPGQYAYKPGDIVTFKNEKTVEIVDTDAEGRLILADALLMAAGEKPDCIIEMSTLTGSIVNALGEGMAGVMGNNKTLVSMLLAAARQTGERLWQLPLVEDYKESIKSKVADLKNAGHGRASSIKAALFLNEFTEAIPFAHIDMAGPAFLSKPNAFYAQEGATGFGVRLIIEFLQQWIKKIKKN